MAGETPTDTPDPDPAPEPADEASALAAERDELAARVASLEGRRRSRARQGLATALVVLTCASFLAASVGVWARRNFLDTTRFVDRVAPLAESPEIKAALQPRLTNRIMSLIDPEELFEEALPDRGQILAAPLANAVEGFVSDRVGTFLDSDRFEELWANIVERGHRAAVRVLRDESAVIDTGGEPGTVQINLIPLINEVLARITEASPELLGRTVDLPTITVDDVPEEAVEKLSTALGVDVPEDFGVVTVYDDGKLEEAQAALRSFDRLVVLLVVVTVLLVPLTLWLSRRRRRTLLQLVAGLIFVVVFLRRAVSRLQDELLTLPTVEVNRAALETTTDAFVDPLLTGAGIVLVVLLLIGVVAAVTGPYPWAVGLRRQVTGLASGVGGAVGDRAGDESTRRWVADHRQGLQIAGAAVGLLVLWVFDLSWWGVIILLAAVAAFEVAASQLGRPAEPDRVDADQRVGGTK